MKKYPNHSVTDRMVAQFSKPECSLRSHEQRSRGPEIQEWHYIFMTALVHSGRVPQKNFPFNNIRTTGEFDQGELDAPQPVPWSRSIASFTFPRAIQRRTGFGRSTRQNVRWGRPPLCVMRVSR